MPQSQYSDLGALSPQIQLNESYSTRTLTIICKAGLLTPGSYFRLRLPDHGQWHLQRLSPVTAAGPFLIFTGFPIMSWRHLDIS